MFSVGDCQDWCFRIEILVIQLLQEKTDPNLMLTKNLTENLFYLNLHVAGSKFKKRISATLWHKTVNENLHV